MVCVGKHNGTFKGVKYFKCKEKHGVFVRPDKIIHEPSKSMTSSAGSRSSLTTSASAKSLSNKTPSPLAKNRRFSSNPYPGLSGRGVNSSRRSSYGTGKRT